MEARDGHKPAPRAAGLQQGGRRARCGSGSVEPPPAVPFSAPRQRPWDAITKGERVPGSEWRRAEDFGA